MRILVTDPLESQLASTGERVELVGKGGEVLGFFEPCSMAAEGQAATEACPYSNEQLQEFAQQTGGRPLAEILSDLRSR